MGLLLLNLMSVLTNAGEVVFNCMKGRCSFLCMSLFCARHISRWHSVFWLVFIWFSEFISCCAYMYTGNVDYSLSSHITWMERLASCWICVPRRGFQLENLQDFGSWWECILFTRFKTLLSQIIANAVTMCLVFLYALSSQSKFILYYLITNKHLWINRRWCLLLSFLDTECIGCLIVNCLHFYPLKNIRHQFEPDPLLLHLQIHIAGNAHFTYSNGF